MVRGTGELPVTSYAPLLNRQPEHSFLGPQIPSARGLIVWGSALASRAPTIVTAHPFARIDTYGHFFSVAELAELRGVLPQIEINAEGSHGR